VGDKIIPRRYEYLERVIMKKFNVQGFEKIYYTRTIEAETEEDARTKAFLDVEENHWTFWDDQEGDILVFEATEVTKDE
jgi:hypothetical protein